jgi:hypothetical protein
LQTKQESIAAIDEKKSVCKDSLCFRIDLASLERAVLMQERRKVKIRKIKKHPLVRNASVRRSEKSKVGIPNPVSWHEAVLVSKWAWPS